MAEPMTILQILLLRDETISRDLNRVLWAAFQEVEAFYNFGEPRAVFRRFYMSKTSPASVLDSVFSGRWKDMTFLPIQDDFWKHTTGKNSKVCDQDKLVEFLNQELLSGQTGKRLIVTDQELTPEEGFSYTVLADVAEGAVASVALTDPRFWRADQQDRINVIKHRIRAVLLRSVGEFLGYKLCPNEQCFLFEDVDTILRLDEMVLLGEEHGLLQLAGRGFAPSVAEPSKVQDPIKVQDLIEVAKAKGAPA